MFRSVKYLIPAFEVNMGGILLKQALPTTRVDQVDPFLLLHHANFTYRADAPAKHQGIGPHPHRGFSPVTFVIDGEVHHRDSRGNNQIAKSGEVQWLNAGAGIIHSERPSQSLTERNGRQEIIQLWVNSPTQAKMQQPHYQHLAENEIPVFSSSDRKVSNKLIAGKYGELQGKIKTTSDLLIIWSKAQSNGSQVVKIPANFNAMIYVVNGSLSITGFGLVEKEDLIVFNDEGDSIEIKANSAAQYLILCGRPLNEKIAQQGPFVMNTETEILEAMRDYQMGKMGVLIEE